jgi:hypothetical protein
MSDDVPSAGMISSALFNVGREGVASHAIVGLLGSPG